MFETYAKLANWIDSNLKMLYENRNLNNNSNLLTLNDKTCHSQCQEDVIIESSNAVITKGKKRNLLRYKYTSTQSLHFLLWILCKQQQHVQEVPGTTPAGPNYARNKKWQEKRKKREKKLQEEYGGLYLNIHERKSIQKELRNEQVRRIYFLL